jgi:hypothetical protein
VDFAADFSGKMEEFVQNGLKIFKNFRRGQQSTMWPIRDSANSLLLSTVVGFFFLKSTVGQLSKKKPNSRFIVKSRLSTSRLALDRREERGIYRNNGSAQSSVSSHLRDYYATAIYAQGLLLRSLPY